MLHIDKIQVDGKYLQGLKVELKDLPPLLLISGEKGFVMCGYLNIEIPEKLQAAAAIVAGVKTFEDVLNAEIKAATSKAKAMGIRPGKVVKTVIGALA